ncbi:MAG: diaminopimelate decarboxylase, partial [Synergistaceae bacterium]|nr:diaminopimelate decarboxylase [Synergistaceae bacterium]
MFMDHESAEKIVREYGSPVYVYSEKILRERCRDLLDAFDGRIKPSYSAKANSNLTLLRIIREEGLGADAMSPGEIFVLEKAGFSHGEIFYIGNNVSCEEMRYATDRDIMVSVDSLAQLEQFGQINPGGRVAVRFNPGLGAGHCDKVVTAGHHTKFGVQAEFCPQVKELLKKYGLTLAGINQHIGSLFLDADPYVEAAEMLLDMIGEEFPGLEFIDFGGGFGVPYKPSEHRLDFNDLTGRLFPVMDKFIERYDNKDVRFKCEPGRYIVAECGVLLGTVHAVKENYGSVYVGTDIGFNVLMRPVLYDSYHELSVLRADDPAQDYDGSVIVTGNICESGDIIASGRNIGPVKRGDIIAVSNAGAYGYSMASNYNCRLRPAEALIAEGGGVRVIRRADPFESLTANF